MHIGIVLPALIAVHEGAGTQPQPDGLAGAGVERGAHGLGQLHALGVARRVAPYLDDDGIRAGAARLLRLLLQGRAAVEPMATGKTLSARLATASSASSSERIMAPALSDVGLTAPGVAIFPSIAFSFMGVMGELRELSRRAALLSL